MVPEPTVALIDAINLKETGMTSILIGDARATNLPASRRGPLTNPLVRTAFLLFAIGLLHLWVVTAGTFSFWPVYGAYYSKLTDAFLHGQVSLRTLPSPEMLALPDPYDPTANQPWRLHDAVLFKGKYYLYWGPAPALIAAGICRAAGITEPHFGDQFVVFPFLFGTVVLAAILLLQIRARLFPRLSLAAFDIVIASLGVGTPVLFMLARPSVYEAAICGGQFFLIAAILALWRGLGADRVKWLPITIAGASLAHCAGSRISLAPAIAAIAALALWRIWRLSDSRPRAIAASIGLLLPPAAGGAWLAWYNYARFHSIFEFGIRYQLAFRNQHAALLSEYSSPKYVPINAYRYLLSLPQIDKSRLSIVTNEQAPWIARYFHLPASFGYEWMVGLVWSQPFVLVFASLAALALIRKILAECKNAPNVPDSPLTWLTLTLFLAAILGFVPCLTVEGSTMRYLLDAIPCATILAALGFWSVLDRATPRRRWWIQYAACALVLLQTSLAVVLSYTG